MMSKLVLKLRRRILNIFDDSDFDDLKLQRIICFFAGHVSERDQCDKPEHDFCLWCFKPMPFKASR